MSLVTGKAIRKMAAIGAGALAPVVVATGVAQAAYGPPPPPGPPGTGGYECILTSQDVPDFAPRTIGPVRDGDLLVTLHIRAYSFDGPVQVTLTEPYSAGGGCNGAPRISGRDLHGFKPIGGIGVLIGLTNEPYGRFLRPVRLTIADPRLSRAEIGEIAPLYGNRLGARDIRAHGDSVTLYIESSSDWAFLVKRLRGRAHRLERTTAQRLRRFRQGPAALTVTAALLPRGSALPGNGVLVAAGNGYPLSTRDSAARAK